MFMKKNRDIIIFIITFVIIFILSVFVNHVEFDEIWNYGFSFNISKGLIPYRDFNMLQTPFSLFVGSIFIKIFGDYLISVYILNSLVISFSIFLLYKIINYKVFLFVPLFYLYTVFGYNCFCLFFLIFIIYFIYKGWDDSLWIGIIIGICFITKQTIGICLFVPYFWYSRNRIKSIILFMIPFLLLSIYLIYYDAFFQFIDYCFLGLLDFGVKNTNVAGLFIIEIIVCLFLLIFLIKSGLRDKMLFYILAFQVMAFPLSDMYHFIIAIIPVVFYVVYRISFRYVMIFVGMVSYFIFFVSFVRNIVSCYHVMEDNYLYLRNINANFYGNIVSKSNIINDGLDDDVYLFVISPDSYFIKLYLGIEIGKYDFLLKGNMGYNGDDKMIKDIEKKCLDHKCKFYVNKGIIFSPDNQFSRDIYDYSISHYNYLEGNGYFDIYYNY